MHQHHGLRVVDGDVAVLAVAHGGDRCERLLLRFVFENHMLLREGVVTVDDANALLHERGQLVASIEIIDERFCQAPKAPIRIRPIHSTAIIEPSFLLRVIFCKVYAGSVNRSGLGVGWQAMPYSRLRQRANRAAGGETRNRLRNDALLRPPTLSSGRVKAAVEVKTD